MVSVRMNSTIRMVLDWLSTIDIFSKSEFKVQTSFGIKPRNPVQGVYLGNVRKERDVSNTIFSNVTQPQELDLFELI